jgi:hypothetical protein
MVFRLFLEKKAHVTRGTQAHHAPIILCAIFSVMPKTRLIQLNYNIANSLANNFVKYFADKPAVHLNLIITE